MIEITNYKAINKGTLVGSFSVRIVGWGMYINDMNLFQKEGKRWVTMPSRMYEKDGTKKYFPYCGFEKSELTERFNTSVLKAIDEYMITKSKELEQNQGLKEEVHF